MFQDDAISSHIFLNKLFISDNSSVSISLNFDKPIELERNAFCIPSDAPEKASAKGLSSCTSRCFVKSIFICVKSTLPLSVRIKGSDGVLFSSFALKSKYWGYLVPTYSAIVKVLSGKSNSTLPVSSEVITPLNNLYSKSVPKFSLLPCSNGWT